MIKESAQVIAIDDQSVWLQSTRHSVCDTCKVKAGCGQKLVQKHMGRSHIFQVDADKQTTQHLSLHDTVEVGIDESLLLRGSLFLYLFPLATMLAGSLVTSWLNPASPEWLLLVMAFVGLGAGLLVVAIQSRRQQQQKKYRPTLCTEGDGFKVQES